MVAIQITAERTIDAPATRVYSYIADYRQHHPRFLPPAFSNFQVEQGGVGAGTVIRFRVKAGGRTQEYHQRVTEPVPGRTISEQNIDSDLTTSFTVTPDGRNCRVQITTTWQRAGIGGVIERIFAPRVLSPLYADELERLNRYAREQAKG
jgi:uncharacterized protein YndB with AHSA1/START domain